MPYHLVDDQPLYESILMWYYKTSQNNIRWKFKLNFVHFLTHKYLKLIPTYNITLWPMPYGASRWFLLLLLKKWIEISWRNCVCKFSRTCFSKLLLGWCLIAGDVTLGSAQWLLSIAIMMPQSSLWHTYKHYDIIWYVVNGILNEDDDGNLIKEKHEKVHLK